MGVVVKETYTYEEVQALIAKIAWLEEQIILINQQRFGRKTEAIPDQNQIMLFDLVNEAETTAEFSISEPTTEEALETVTYRRKKSKGKRDKDLAGLPTEQVYIKVEEPNCPKCGEEMVKIGEEVIRRELEYTPAQYKVIEYIAEKVVCKNCEDGIIVEAKLTEEQQPLIAGSIATPALVASVINEKYALGVPIARQSAELARHDVTLSRQTLSNWVVYSAEYLRVIYDALHEELLKMPLIHADETTLQVVTHDRGVVVDKHSYVWLYRTSGDTAQHIVIFHFGDGRKMINPEEFLKGFTGFCHCDGYAAYHVLLTQGVILCVCWAHMRRKFVDALKAQGFDLKKAAEIPKDNPAFIGLCYCDRILAVERKISELDLDEKLKIRLNESKPLTDKFFSWIKTVLYEEKSKLGKAVTYAVNQEVYLRSFLIDGRVELTNNRAERTVKNFVIGRKNWMTCQSEDGAKAAALFYSLVETAKENGLKPYEYIKFLLDEYRLRHFCQDTPLFDLQKYMPWSESLPDHIKLI